MAEAIQGENNRLEEIMPELTFRDYILKYKQLLHDNSNAFQTTFGVPLSQFWDTFTGFDVVKFDEWLGTPDGTSTRDYITSKYGEEATKLVEGLI